MSSYRLLREKHIKTLDKLVTVRAERDKLAAALKALRLASFTAFETGPEPTSLALSSYIGASNRADEVLEELEA